VILVYKSAEVKKLAESQFTELRNSTVKDTSLAILKRQGSQGISIVLSKKKFVLEM